MKRFLILALFLVGCQLPQQRVVPRLVDPPYGGIKFIQAASTEICNGSRGGCTQQVFTVTLPNVRDGDSVKIAMRWFAAYTIDGINFIIPPTPAVIDSSGSPYSLVQMVASWGTPTQIGYIFSTPSVNSGGKPVTVQVTLPIPTSNYTAVVALEYSGGGAIDNHTSNSLLAPSPANSGPFYISSDEDMVLSLYIGSLFGTTACPAPTCTLRFSGSNFVVQESFPTAAGNYTAYFSNIGGYSSYMVAAAAFQ